MQASSTLLLCSWMGHMTGYLYVKNWDELQHYKTRRPPWIKLYRRLLEDWEFLELTETAQLQLIKIWIISAENLPGGWVKNDPKLVRALIKLQPKTHLKVPELVKRGWLERRSQAEYDEARASTLLAPRYQDASPLVQRTELEKPSFLPTSTTDVANGNHEEGKEGLKIGTVLRAMP